ncbi:Pycsar system effector family protein [Nonomuraea salmonea]|uniref:Pycsar system effector family protein n=1 Tax=Nonomuraea salmonea TaxID=46181 RepID=A0ABV5P4S7_9ACTN
MTAPHHRPPYPHSDAPSGPARHRAEDGQTRAERARHRENTAAEVVDILKADFAATQEQLKRIDEKAKFFLALAGGGIVVGADLLTAQPAPPPTATGWLISGLSMLTVCVLMLMGVVLPRLPRKRERAYGMFAVALRGPRAAFAAVRRSVEQVQDDLVDEYDRMARLAVRRYKVLRVVGWSIGAAVLQLVVAVLITVWH